MKKGRDIMARDIVAASYARDSRDDGSESFGIDYQTRYNLGYAEKYHMIVPPDYVLEEEHSGKDWSRPKFDTLKQLIEFHHIDAVIVYKVNRISRIDYHALMFLRDFCFRHKVDLHIVEWGRPVKDDSNDVILFGLQAQFGHIERDDILRRTQRGRVEKVTQGVFLGQGTCVYGYEKTGSKKNTALSIIPEEAAIITLIFGMFVQKHIQITDIARYLNAQHIPSPSELRNRFWQRSEWNYNSILRILRDPRYTGTFYAFRYIRNGITGNTTLRDKTAWIKQDFADLAIIDQELFNVAQDIINSRKNRYTFSTKYEYLLSKRMWCACGHKAGVQTKVQNGRNNQYYRCSHKGSTGNKECKMPYLNSRRVDDQIWSSIEYFIRNPEIVLEELRAAQDKQKQEHHDAVITLDTLDEIRRDYTQRVNKLYDDYDRKLIPESVYLQRKTPLDEGLQTAEKLYAEQQAILNEKVLSDGEIKHIIHTCGQFSEILDKIGTLDFSDRLKAIELFNIAGVLTIQDSTIILTLYIHNWYVDTLVVSEQHLSKFLMDVLLPQPGQVPLALRIIVGHIK